MRRIVIVVSAALALAACAGGALDRPAATKAAAGLAERAFAEECPRHRVACVAGIAAVLSEIATFRVRTEAPQETPETIAFLDRLMATLDAIEADDGTWYETHIHDLIFVAGHRFRQRIEVLIGDGIPDIARVFALARKIGRGRAVAADVRGVIGRVAAGKVTETQAITLFRQRIAANRAILDAMRPALGPGPAAVPVPSSERPS